MVPTDLILVFRNEDDRDVLKKDMMSYFKKKSSTVDTCPISGGEGIEFDLKHTPTADGKVVSLKVPVKLYFRKKIMVHGSQESRDIFIDFFYAFNNRKRSSEDKSTASDVFIMNWNMKDLNWAGVIHRLPGCGLTGYPLGFHRLVAMHQTPNVSTLKPTRGYFM